ncbi:SIS domain-containing protein [Duncaniella freteri]|uniref:SIS domain-containing protein n=1 Tax=Duncaniella freteri TaxID=2530391 RepID=A0A4Z0V8S7_9BACT|nr:SIS domain-containing protein [Duncaniella freteri]MDE7026894.1 SIS domain-containing protein [Duncaniella freteri]NBJ08685.1 SIS domain-containing protein [Alistipes sp. Z76]NCE70690.1 SIS domain-containing protein [Muribaculaceae bacterium M3]TGG40185.1 SIS domain-containing protein [Duncaniella freteri]
MTIKQSMHDILEHEAKALLSIPYSEDYDRAIELIIEHVHRRGGKLVASGMGKAGQVALNIATTFSSTGTPGVFLHPGEAQHGDIGVLQPNDVMLLISNSGTTREMLDLVALTKDLHPEIPVIAMTGNPESELSRLSDVTLLTGGAPEVCPLGLTPTTSTTVMTAIGDVLIVNVMNLIGLSSKEYSKRHHGGFLGHKSRKESGY